MYFFVNLCLIKINNYFKTKTNPFVKFNTNGFAISKCFIDYHVKTFSLTAQYSTDCF